MSESSEFPSLFLSLSESENEEEKTDNNANILCNKEDRPMANCQSMVMLTKKITTTKLNRIEQIVGKCRALVDHSTNRSVLHHEPTRKHCRKPSKADHFRKKRVCSQYESSQLTTTSPKNSQNLQDGNLMTTSHHSGKDLQENWLKRHPALSLKKESNGVVLTWHFNQLSDHKLVKFYRVFAKEENSDWIKLGEVESLRLPMGCRLSISDAGKSYKFKVQPVSKTKHEIGLFSNECSST